MSDPKESSTINNKRIAKNTLYMYVRMFFILGVTLFTARVVINSLGIDEYGIYNIVGGIVILFSFVNISLRSSFQRFYSFELGKNNEDNIYRVLSSSIVIVTAFALILLILAETIGLWFVTNKLVIPEERLNAALWVYQFSIATFIFNLYQTPFQAIIISYEKLSFYAIYSIIDVILKLLIAYAIYISPVDKLIIYGCLGALVALISLLFACFYVLYYLKIPLIFEIHKSIVRPVFSYAGWSMANSSTVIVAQQGGNILLNMFYGVVANGAFGIANQVTGAVNGFVSNFQSAFNPQIVKSYAAQESEAMFQLINRACLFSFYLLLIISVPFFVEGDYILRLWLGETPQYAGVFCQLMLCYCLIDAAQAPLWMLIHATGKIRIYQIWSGALTLLNIPLAGVVLYWGGAPYWVFIIRVGMNLLIAIIRPRYLHGLVKEFSINKYLKDCILPISKTFGAVICILYFLKKSEILSEFMKLSVSILVSLCVIWFLGMTSEDKNILKKTIRNRIKTN